MLNELWFLRFFWVVVGVLGDFLRLDGLLRGIHVGKVGHVDELQGLHGGGSGGVGAYMVTGKALRVLLGRHRGVLMRREVLGIRVIGHGK